MTSMMTLAYDTIPSPPPLDCAAAMCVRPPPPSVPARASVRIDVGHGPTFCLRPPCDPSAGAPRGLTSLLPACIVEVAHVDARLDPRCEQSDDDDA